MHVVHETVIKLFYVSKQEFENEVFHTDKGTLTEATGERGVEESIWKRRQN
jgi:hypothetical protein